MPPLHSVVSLGDQIKPDSVGVGVICFVGEKGLFVPLLTSAAYCPSGVQSVLASPSLTCSHFQGGEVWRVLFTTTAVGIITHGQRVLDDQSLAGSGVMHF